MNPRKHLLVQMVFILLLITGAYASGSEAESPRASANDNARKATAVYNEGVHNMDRAKEIAQKGDSAYAYNYRATSDAKARREYEKASGAFQKAAQLNPKFKEAYNNLGYCLRKLGKLQESLAAYDKAISLDSNFAQAREYRGETYLALDRLTSAESELAFLQSLKSPYVDQLTQSIELYKLARIEKAANGKK